jgi:CheY-like chemotaxis protein
MRCSSPWQVTCVDYSVARLCPENGEDGMPKQIQPVLLITDVTDHARIIQETLQDHFPEACLAVVPDSSNALDFLFSTGQYTQRRTRLLPQLILIDVQSPTSKSLTALHVLTFYLRTRSIPIVALIRSDEERHLLEDQQLNIKDYLYITAQREPFHLVINHLLIRWLQKRKTGTYPDVANGRNKPALT